MKTIFPNSISQYILFILFIFLLNNNRIEAKPLGVTSKITGRVTSIEDGEGLQGATVSVKGYQNETIADLNGEFTIEVTIDDAVLVFSMAGYITQEIPVNSQSIIEVALHLNTSQKEVVTALGIKREKRSLGYAISEIEGEEITQVVQENFLNSLADRIPGVQVNQTSGVGSSTSVIIRGATSLNDDNQPLFVVDGIPMHNSLNNIMQMGDLNMVDYGNAIADLNPEDIEAISVLKYPGAAALYGARANNGVIFITTKSAKGIGVSFSTNTVFEIPYRYLNLHYKYGPGQFNHQFDENSSYWGGPALDVGNTAIQWNSPLDENGNQIPTELKSYPDNMKNFLQTGMTTMNNIAYSNATENTGYRISYTNMSHKGIIPNADHFRNTLSLSGFHNIAENLTLKTNINVLRSNSNDRPATSNRGANPLEAVYAYPHADVREMRDFWHKDQDHIQQNWVSAGVDNPYFIAYGINNAFFRNRMYGNLALAWQISPAFSVSARYAMDRFEEERETKIPFSYSRGARGGYFLTDISSQETNADFLASYRKDVGLFDVNISIGGNIMRRELSSSSVGSGGNRNNGLVIPGVYNEENIPSENISIGSSTAERSIHSLYALASIGFKDQVYLDITGRNDWYSTVTADNHSNFYPSASLSVIVNEIVNMGGSVNLLKLRTGWVNNYGISSYEIGKDLVLFNNRLRFGGSYYMINHGNQQLILDLNPNTGYTSKLISGALTSSKGWELVLDSSPLLTPDWKWDININFTHYTTTLEKLVEGLEFLQIWAENGGGAITFVGEEIGNLYSAGYAYVRDPNSPYYRWPVLSENGEWIELSGRENMRHVGNFNPDFLMGMQTSLSFNRFTLSASFDWRQGGEFISFTYRYGESDWKSQRQLDNLIRGGLYSQDELVALLKSDPEQYIIPRAGNYPRVGGYTAETGGLPMDAGGRDGAFVPGVIQTAGVDTPDDFSDDEYEEHLGGMGTNVYPITYTYPWNYNEQVTFDASFIKLRELSLTYQLPDISFIYNATIALYTRNVMLWTKAGIGIDPERAFWASSNMPGDIQVQFRQGIERQNVVPWVMPLGIKLSLNF